MAAHDYIVQLIPIFSDNYVFLIINNKSMETIAVDPGEASAILEYIKKNNLKLTTILITHHHADHIGGLTELKKQTGAHVYAPQKNKDQIPDVDTYVQEKNNFSAAGLEFQVFELPGHTLGHVAFWLEQQHWLFSGDVLFGLGCGRLFEGTAAQMFLSLQKIKELPADTLIYCTHEYTETNIRFCQQLLQDEKVKTLTNQSELTKYAVQVQQKRSKNQPSVPLLLAMELKVNPFMQAPTENDFKTIRELRNIF